MDCKPVLWPPPTTVLHHYRHRAVATSEHRGTARGFLPRGLSNTCPQACAMHGTAVSHGQVSNKPKQNRSPSHHKNLWASDRSRSTADIAREPSAATKSPLRSLSLVGDQASRGPWSNGCSRRDRAGTPDPFRSFAHPPHNCTSQRGHIRLVLRAVARPGQHAVLIGKRFVVGRRCGRRSQFARTRW
jgi:hypothetical protein